MRNNSISFFLVICFFLTSLTVTNAVTTSNNKKSGRVSSYIKEVTVFSDRALVVRQASVVLVSGEQTVHFGLLPGNTDPDTIQIKGKGAAAIKGVQVKPIYMDESDDADLKTLNEQLEMIVDRIAGINDQANHASQEKKFIESIAKRLTTATDKSSQAELDPKKWIDMVAFYRNKLDKLDKETRASQAVLKPLTNKKRKIEQDIRELRGRIQYTKYDVSVILTSQQTGKVTLALSYIVQGPNWQPKYDVRADSKKANVQVAYHANIRQNTGEDWRNAKIILSTAQPKAGDKHPELGPWRINPYYPRPKPAKKRRSKKYAKSVAPMMSVAARKSSKYEEQDAREPMKVIQAVAKTTGTAVNFDIKGKHTIKSNNQPQQVTIMIQQFSAIFKYSTVPKLVSQAYLKAEIKNETDFPLLAGETNIFLDNNFVASGSIDTVAPAETFWAFLGIDEGIKVEYKIINRKQEKQGVFGERIKATYDYIIKVTNHKKQMHDLVIQDQLPLSGHKDIQVELISPTYKENDKSFTKNNENLLEWNQTIKAGEKIEIPLKFTVSYPEKMQVQGL